MNRLRPVFAAARTSFSQTIRPNEESKRLIHLMREEFATKRRFTPYVGVHIRRGDRTVMPWRYDREPIPVQAYVEASAQLGADRYVYLASDAPGFEPAFPRAFSLRRSRLRELASSEAYAQADFERMEEKERVRLTRGMIVDFALLSGMWGEERERPIGTVCTVRFAPVFYGRRSMGSDEKFVTVQTFANSPLWALVGKELLGTLAQMGI